MRVSWFEPHVHPQVCICCSCNLPTAVFPSLVLRMLARRVPIFFFLVLFHKVLTTRCC